MEAPASPVLSSLQSKAQIELLDAIDNLRADGFSGGLDFPQLIVCGNQSCGKSSVLEAISHVRFPAADTACTRFPTELVLRKADSSSMSVKLIPAVSRRDMERLEVSRFQAPKEMVDAHDLAGIIKAAQKHIDDIDDGPEGQSMFCQDKLQAIVCAPDLPPLTLVDLPGLAKTREHGTENIDVVEKIVKSYMADKNSIILAVVNANYDVANQEVVEIAKSLDPKGSRTLGIMTKPDVVEAGSPAEAQAISLARNQRGIHFDLGWHVLKNRAGHAHRDDTSKQRDDSEEAFFKSSRWSLIPEDSRGVKALRQRLSDVLFRSISNNLPDLVTSIDHKISTCENNLRKLGEPKDSEKEQRIELTSISSRVERTVKSSVNGYYDGDFFHLPSQHNPPVRQLRSCLRTVLDDFSKRMKEDGHYYCFTKATDHPERTASFSTVPAIVNTRHHPVQISLQCAESAVGEYIRANRGLEPPGFPPSGAIAHMFRVQSSPWRAIAEHCIEQCWLASQSFFVQVLEHFAPPHIAHAIWNQVADVKLAAIRANLAAKLEELLKPYKKGFPITLDISRSLRSVGDSLSPEKPLIEDYVAWRALECLDEYYKIAVATFPETVATLAIENCLVDGLLEIFTPMTVAGFDAETLCNLTAEPENVTTERVFNQKRLTALKSIACVFSRHTHGPLGYQETPPNVPRERYDHTEVSPTAPNVRLVNADNHSIFTGNRMPLTPPKSPNDKLSHTGSLGSVPATISLSPSSSATDVLEARRERETSTRQSTPRRKPRGVARTLANQSPAPQPFHVDQLVSRRHAFAEDTSDSEL